MRRKREQKPDMYVEDKQQIEFISWCREAAEKQTDKMLKDALNWIHSSLNGVRLRIGQAMKAKRMGMTKGVSDICLPFNQLLLINQKQFVYVGLYIEMKAAKGKPTPEQIAFGEFVTASGYFYREAYSWNEAARIIVEYLDLEEGTYREIGRSDWEIHKSGEEGPQPPPARKTRAKRRRVLTNAKT